MVTESLLEVMQAELGTTNTPTKELSIHRAMLIHLVEEVFLLRQDIDALKAKKTTRKTKRGAKKKG